MRETISSAKTIDDAVALGASKLGVTADQVRYEVLDEPRRGILGIGAVEARVRVYLEETPVRAAVDFVKTLLENMKVDAEVSVDSEDEEGAFISINGEGLGVLIGRHGDVLDSIQYLATLAANRNKPGFYRITLDIENYREKRAKTLKSLAKRMADKVLKYKRSFALEPMNAYERRIIHSECQNISGVTTYSVGDGADRKIVIAPEGKGDKTKKTKE